jgi:hypothetical protein
VDAIRDGRSNEGATSNVQTLSNPIITKLRDYQLIRPSLLGGDERLMEQLAPGDHPPSISYRIQAFGKDFDMTLNKNNELFSSNYQQLRLAYDPNDATKAPRIERTEAVNCYYHGHVAGDSDSVVTMSTCNGLRGSIRGHGEYFAVEPASFVSSLPTLSSGFASQSRSSSPIGFSPSSLPAMNAHPLHAAVPLSRIPTTDHLVYRHADLQEEEKTCGLPSEATPSTSGSNNGNSNSNSNGRTNGAYTEAPIDDASTPTSPDSSAAAGVAATTSADQGGHGPNGERETIELLVFNDNQRWKNKGESTEANTLAILNEMKQFYSATTFTRAVNVILVGQVTFSQGDPYNADMTSSGVAVEGERGLLNVFHRYRNLAQNVLPRHDNGQLFSERHFTSNIMGLAGVGSMCSEQSGSIACMTSDSIVKNAMISAHETGHTLTMMHDGVYNTCPSGGFIMQTTTGTATTFSHCSVDSANTFLPSASCLYNYAARRATIERADTSWISGPWSDCSVTCSSGIQVRTVDCRDSNGRVKAKNDCNEFTKPLSVRVCNASIICDPCALRNCSGIGICRDGTCLCPSGTTGRQCEIQLKSSSKSDSTRIPEEQSASTMALAITAAVTGVALACATFLWLCRVIQRHTKDRSMRVSMLPSSIPTSSSHKQLASSPSAEFAEARGAPSPIPEHHDNEAHNSNGHDNSNGNGNGNDGSNTAMVGSTSNDDTSLASQSAPPSVPTGLHKTPRSVPRTIAVKA